MKHRISKIVSILLALVISCTFSLNVFAASSYEEVKQNLEKAIKGDPIATIPVDSEEEAAELITKLEAQTTPTEAVVYNEQNTLESARVSFAPTYEYRVGEVAVHGTVTVHNNSINTWISSINGYVAAANDCDGWREDIRYTNYLPTKSTYIYESGTLYHNVETTDLVLFEGEIDVYLTGGWSTAHLEFSNEMYL